MHVPSHNPPPMVSSAASSLVGVRVPPPLSCCVHLSSAMASVVAWGTSSVPASTVAVSAALGFAALWLLSVDLTSKRLPSYKYAFVGFAGVLVLAGWLGQGLTGDAAAMAAVLAGAAAVLASLLVQHTTTMLALTAAGCTAALAFSDALVEGQVVGPLGRSALLLFVGYLASRAGKRNYVPRLTHPSTTPRAGTPPHFAASVQKCQPCSGQGPRHTRLWSVLRLGGPLSASAAAPMSACAAHCSCCGCWWCPQTLGTMARQQRAELPLLQCQPSL